MNTQQNLTGEQVSEIVFEGIERNLSNDMTFKQENENEILFAYKLNVIPSADVNRVNAVCRQHSLVYNIIQHPRGIAFQISKIISVFTLLA